MHIRCPHCHDAIEIVEDVELSNVECPSCGSGFSLVGDDTESYKQEEKTIGHFTLVRQLGVGAFGSVWRANDTELDRKVAVKIPRKGQLTPSESEQFLREARSAAQLKHPNIVPVHEVGREDGQVYIVSDLIDGVTLADRLEEGPLSVRESAELVAKIAEAVHHAHERGVVHRDLKPANVMLDGDNEPHVMDFGLAKRDSGEITMTVEGALLGTPAYMSPEQALGEGHDADARSDVYSLGVILFNCMTGDLPFRGNKRMLLHKVINEESPSPRTLDSAIPKDLETICLKCLHKERGRRYTSAAHLSRDLRRWLGGEPIEARPVGLSEKGWLWCRRRPVVASLISLLVVGAIVASTTIYDRQNAATAAEMIDSLVTAEMAEVPDIAGEMQELRFWAEPRLKERFAAAKEGSDEKRRLRLAILQFDDAEVINVIDDLLDAELPSVRAIVELLTPHRRAVTPKLLDVFHQRETAFDNEVRFRAGLALAYLSPDSPEWEPSDYKMLANNLVAANPIHQDALFPVLKPIREQMIRELETIFNDNNREREELVAAANAIVFFSAGDARRLAKLMLAGNGPQYKILFKAYQEVADEATTGRFAEAIPKQPTDKMGVAARIALGKQRATSAITLLRQGERESVLPVLRNKDDPEALTQFIHRCRPRGVAATALIELFEKVDEGRGTLDGGGRQKRDANAMYALLLALGEFAWEELPPARDALGKRLGAVYEKDPSSGVHSATGWLLRRWGRGEVVDRVDQTPLPYDPSGHREWYVQPVEYTPKELGGGLDGLPGGTRRFHLTFIVFKPDTFTMGSPADAPNHRLDQAQHQVTLTRPIAVCDREVSWAQWMAMEGKMRRDVYARQFSRTLGDAEPVFGVAWFDAVKYCRWLTDRTGNSEEDQCYPDPASLPKDGDKNPVNWPLRLDAAGFRLPTEAEWEFICRSGTLTAYSFGNDERLLDRYAWYMMNSGDSSHPTGELCPNPRGLFDIHGNLSEWCHDWYTGGELSDATDPTGAKEGRDRVRRGGGWDFTARACRSALRFRRPPTARSSNLGFRVAAVPPSQGPEAEKRGSEADSGGR